MSISLAEFAIDRVETRLYTWVDPPDENKHFENFFFTLSKTRVMPTF
jgi:hypothetical protein